MADQILIVPEGFQTEVDALTSAKDAVSDEILKIETEGLDLETINQLKDVVNKFNSVVKAYKGLLEQDVKNLQTIKSEWMATDAAIATHGQWFTGSAKFGQQ